MRVPIVVPELGVGTESVRVNGWFVHQGDWVVAGELLVELLFAGMTFDLSADSTGQIAEITRDIDSEVKSGELLGWVESPTVEIEVSDM